MMTQKQFADHRGVGKSAVSNWKRDKLLVLAEHPVTGRVMVDVERTDAKLNAKLDPMRGRPPTGNGAEAPTATLALDTPPAVTPPTSPAGNRTIADERIEQVREQRIGNALKNAQLAGDLVPLVEAERRVGEVGRAARERMHAWFRGVAERIAAEKDIRAIMALGEQGIDGVFAELADAAVRGEFTADEEDLTAAEQEELATLADEAA